MQFLGACIVLMGTLTAPGNTPVVLENESIRLELEPRTFSVRFVGFPGGKNFLDLIHLPASAIAGPGWLEPGGLTTDLIPETENSALLRRGPAELIAHERQYVLLLGPKDDARQWRIKKEYFLTPGQSEVRYKVTVLSPVKEERPVGVRITAQLPEVGELRFPGAAGTLGLLSGDFPGFALLEAGGADASVIPLAGGGMRRRAVVEIPAAMLVYETPFGQWTRSMEVLSGLGSGEDATPSRALLLLDDDTHVYQAGLDVMQAGINVGAPLVVQERWVLSKPAATGDDGR